MDKSNMKVKVKKDISGQIFNRLTVIKQGEDLIVNSGRRRAQWLCKCVCGSYCLAISSTLKSGRKKSCGCLQDESRRNKGHGLSRTKIYNSWRAMKERCGNPNNKEYERYGGSGISYDPRWVDFTCFWEDMAPSWNEGLTLDRIDGSQDYQKDNCRWATAKQQARNCSRSNKNTSGTTGVYPLSNGKGNEYWCASWTDLEGRTRTKQFPIREHGNNQALMLACEARREAINCLNLEGAGYSDLHGNRRINEDLETGLGY